jgi:hypothetical protein
MVTCPDHSNLYTPFNIANKLIFHDQTVYGNHFSIGCCIWSRCTVSLITLQGARVYIVDSFTRRRLSFLRYFSVLLLSVSELIIDGSFVSDAFGACVSSLRLIFRRHGSGGSVEPTSRLLDNRKWVSFLKKERKMAFFFLLLSHITHNITSMLFANCFPSFCVQARI